MKLCSHRGSGKLRILIVFMLGTWGMSGNAQQVDDDDIGGIVRSDNGPEAGVWVIAETDEFETRFAKIVVTDEQGIWTAVLHVAGAALLRARSWGLSGGVSVLRAASYLGVASGRPPSTGIVAPVVGVCRVAKNRTALATWLAVILSLRRLRFW